MDVGYASLIGVASLGFGGGGWMASLLGMAARRDATGYLVSDAKSEIPGKKRG
jgi:hypothetical protein